MCIRDSLYSLDISADISKEYKLMGFKGVTLGDTTGMATPPVVIDAIHAIRDKVPDLEITLHFHNTRGVGLANVMTGLNEGITDYESCFGGMGGCPLLQMQQVIFAPKILFIYFMKWE